MCVRLVRCVAVCWNPGITANAGGVCVAVAVRVNEPKLRESKLRRKNRAMVKHLRVVEGKTEICHLARLGRELMRVIGRRSPPVRLSSRSSNSSLSRSA